MAEEKSAEEAPKKSKKMLIIILGAVLLLGGGGVGAFLALHKSGPTKKPAPKPGKVVAIDPITLNLADGHYLKLGLALQATATAAADPDGSQAEDIAISMFSNMPVAELSSNAQREKEKKELTEKVVKAYGEDEVMAVYFTTFVMQ